MSPQQPDLPQPQKSLPQTAQTIVFFDGVCGLCNRLIDFLLRVDTRGRLRFAPLQGKTASEHLKGLVPESVVQDVQSLVVVRRGRAYLRSEAVLALLASLGWPWSLGLLVRAVPLKTRDEIYRFMARHRYAWFGKSDTCRVPSPEERSRFLD